MNMQEAGDLIRGAWRTGAPLEINGVLLRIRAMEKKSGRWLVASPSGKRAEFAPHFCVEDR